MLRFPLLQNFCLPPFITGRFVTAASLFVLSPPPLHSSPFVSSQFSSWHCPQLRSSLHMGIIGSDLAERCHMMPTCVWCFAGTPLTQEMLPAFFPPSCSAAESRALQLNPVSVLQSIPHWFQPLPGYRLPQTMRLCYNFRLAGAMGISCELPKAVYGRTEELELHNRQLPCPRIPPPPSNSICGESVGGFGWAQIKNSQTHSRQKLRKKWNTHCTNDISHCGGLFGNS